MLYGLPGIVFPVEEALLGYSLKRFPMLEEINILARFFFCFFFLPFASKILKESLLFYHAKQEEQAKMNKNVFLM